MISLKWRAKKNSMKQFNHNNVINKKKEKKRIIIY